MVIQCNAGVLQTRLMGELPGYDGEVWYNPDGIANILSFLDVKKHYRVTFDSATGGSFIVHKADSSMREFHESPGGLFYMVAKNSVNVDKGTTLVSPGTVSTVDDKQSNYTERAYSRAVAARKFQDMIGPPSTRRLLEIIDKNLIMGCTVTLEDVMAAEDIFGTNLGSLKGKTPHRASVVVDQPTTSVPDEIMRVYHDIVLAADLIFVNQVPLLVTTSHHLKFATVSHLSSRVAKQILAGLRQTNRLYRSRGFNVVECRGDFEFKGVRDGLADAGIMLNTMARNEHVPEIERYNRTLKDRVRSAFNMLPFKPMPRIMIVELVKAMVFWLNAFPASDGVSAT